MHGPPSKTPVLSPLVNAQVWASSPGTHALACSLKVCYAVVGMLSMSSWGTELHGAHVGGTSVCRMVFTGIVQEQFIPFWKDPAQAWLGSDFIPFWNNPGKGLTWPVNFAMMGAEEKRS